MPAHFASAMIRWFDRLHVVRVDCVERLTALRSGARVYILLTRHGRVLCSVWHAYARGFGLLLCLDAGVVLLLPTYTSLYRSLHDWSERFTVAHVGVRVSA